MRRSSTSADCSPRTCVASQASRVHARPAPDVAVEEARRAGEGLRGVALAGGGEGAADRAACAPSADAARLPDARQALRRRRRTGWRCAAASAGGCPPPRPARHRQHRPRPAASRRAAAPPDPRCSAASSALHRRIARRPDRAQAAQQDRAEPGRHLRLRRRVGDLARQHVGHQRGDVSPANGRCAVERLVERDAEAELIGARVGRGRPANCSGAMYAGVPSMRARSA